jgi:hypothetical protein
MDWKIEVVTVPVSDIDRARDFYAETSTSRSATTSASFKEDLDNVGCVFFSDPDGNRWCVQQIPARD